MIRHGHILLVAVILAPGCAHVSSQTRGAPPYRAYRKAEFDWSSVRRVLVLPLSNETEFPQVSDEIARELAASLQSSLASEIVLAPPGLAAPKCDELRHIGKYDELELIELANKFQVDAVLLGTVTQYRPYAPPRIGLTVQLISISQDIPIASVDGLWDARDAATAELARDSFHHRSGSSHGLLGPDLVLCSPQQFQRVVCHQAVDAIAGRTSQ